jgi:hypothetical protein
MMSNEEVPRGVPPQPGRRSAPTRFQDSRFNSPSSTYNFNTNAGYQGNGFGGQQHPRRRIDRFKRETINYNDRMIRQNDSIIRLLKEIRDRLPAPPASAAAPNVPDQAVDEAAYDTGTHETPATVMSGNNQGDDQNSNGMPAEDNGEQQPE